MQRKEKKPKVTTIDGLATLVLGLREDMDDRFDAIDERFVSLESEMRGGFTEVKRILERIDSRLSALELAVFGPSGPNGSRDVSNSILGRLAKLERAVFKK